MISMKIPPSNPCFLEVFWHNYLLRMTSPRPLMQLLEDNQQQVKMARYKHLADSSVLDPCRSHHAIFFFQQPYLCIDVLFAGRANKKKNELRVNILEISLHVVNCSIERVIMEEGKGKFRTLISMLSYSLFPI